MKDENGMTEVHDRGDDAAAYVLGALEPEEARAFREHLGTCESCRALVGELSMVTDALPIAAAPVPVPAGARRRLMRAIRDDARQASADGPSARTPRWFGTVSLRTGALMAASAAAAILAAVAVVIGPGSGGGATVIRAQVQGISGSAQLRMQSEHAALLVKHLAAPGRGQIYEVWIQRGKAAPIPARALFDVDRSGSADVEIPASMRGVSAVLVTAEPTGGTQTPTHAPVIIARLD